MASGEMRVSPHHPLALPSGELLQGKKWRSALHVPAGPGVPKIVPAEVLDTGALQRLAPSLRPGSESEFAASAP